MLHLLEFLPDMFHPFPDLLFLLCTLLSYFALPAPLLIPLLQLTFFSVFCCLLSSSLLPFPASLLTPAFLLTFLLCLTLLPSPFTSCFSCYSTFSCTFDIPTFLQVNYYRLLAVLLAHTLMYPCRHLLSLLLLANLSMLLAR